MRLIILGAGGYGRMVYDLAEQSNKYTQIFFLDDNSTADKVVGECEEYHEFVDESTEFYPAFGNNQFRMEYICKLTVVGANIATIVHESAYVSPRTTIGEGTVILPKAIVNTETQIGCGCIVNCGAVVDHDCIIEDGVHICLGAIIKAENHIPKCMKIEAGSVVENRKYPLNGDKWNGYKT